MPNDSEVRNKEAQRKAGGGRKHRLARTCALQPFAKRCRRQPQHHDGQGKYPRELRLTPVIRDRLGYSQQLRQGKFENTECVNLTDTKVNCQRRRWNKPTAVSRMGNRYFAIEERQKGHSELLESRTLLDAGQTIPEATCREFGRLTQTAWPARLVAIPNPADIIVVFSLSSSISVRKRD